MQTPRRYAPMGGSFAPAWVAGFTWNRWQASAVYAVGAFTLLALTNSELSATTQIAMVALMGLVMKNGILLVDQANQSMSRGLETLYRKMNKSRSHPSKPPTIGEVLVWIAKLGGYIGRNSDPPPGMISLWRGWQRLMDMVDDFNDIYG